MQCVTHARYECTSLVWAYGRYHTAASIVRGDNKTRYIYFALFIYFSVTAVLCGF